jgi:hypothetical protein
MKFNEFVLQKYEFNSFFISCIQNDAFNFNMSENVVTVQSVVTGSQTSFFFFFFFFHLILL